jgi:hypothetical protein
VLPTGGKGHGGDEKDLLCCVKRSREACTDLFWVLYGFSGENADPALWRYCFRGALKRGSAVYLLLYGVLKRDSRFLDFWVLLVSALN